MFTVNYSELRANMKSIMDRVSDNHETGIITRKENRNIVMMSEEMYNRLMETVYLMRSKANYDNIMESINELNEGKIHRLDPEDLPE